MPAYFYNPYQFIPVKACAKENRTPFSKIDDLKQPEHCVRHDFWYKKGLSGKITCTLKTRSPLIVGGQQTASDKHGKEPGIVKPYFDKDKKLAIPGNSLRGMVTTVAETISHSSLRVLYDMQEGFYSTRMLTGEAFENIGLLLKKENGWYIFPLEKEPSLGKYDDEDDRHFFDAHQCFHHRHNNERHIDGVLYIRGWHKDMPKKLRETYLPWDGKIVEKDLLPVDEAVVAQLESMLRESREHKRKQDPDDDFPWLPKGYEAHEGRSWDKGKSLVLDGDLIYYKSSFRLRERKTVVTQLSYSAIGRRAVDGALADAFARAAGDDRSILPWGAPKRDHSLTPAEALFGVVEDKPADQARNLASRVRFSDARLLSDASTALLPEKLLKVLNSPKPPSPTLYFSNPRHPGYISKSDLNLNVHEPNGRKRYLPHPDAIDPQDEEQRRFHFEANTGRQDYKAHLHLKGQPVRTGAAFEFEVSFENLAPKELELLHCSLQPVEGFIHRLGLGKPLGLGHVEIVQADISVIDRQQRYTIADLLAEKEAFQPFDPSGLSGSASLIAQETLETLLTLSNPANIHHPVCYPYSQFAGQRVYNESKGFEWFVCNDRAAASGDSDYEGQHLRRLNTRNADGVEEVVPTLDADIDCPKKTQGGGNWGQH
ncbi:MAG: hypothetical protein KDI44_09160 [Thiothrix sp.]|nr:hypothetical protein [Thiothrix sp.]HPQ94480.1 RAMP superfamily CRISPR-associated protein [Thiolinea sp.]